MVTAIPTQLEVQFNGESNDHSFFSKSYQNNFFYTAVLLTKKWTIRKGLLH